MNPKPASAVYISDDDDIVFVKENDGPIRTTIVDAPTVDETERARLLFDAAMRAMYIRYVRRRPEDVLEEKCPGWRNLAVWRQNSCHVDAVLDVVMWGGVWCAAGNVDDEKTYDHVNQKYRPLIKLYAKNRLENRSSIASKHRDSIRDIVCANAKGGGTTVGDAKDNVQEILIGPPCFGSINGNVIDVDGIFHERDVFFVVLKKNITETTFGTRPYRVRQNFYVALGAIIGDTGHFKSALNTTVLADRLDSDETFETDEARWYVFDYYNHRNGPAWRDEPKIKNNENLVGLLLVKKD